MEIMSIYTRYRAILKYHLCSTIQRKLKSIFVIIATLLFSSKHWNSIVREASQLTSQK